MKGEVTMKLEKIKQWMKSHPGKRMKVKIVGKNLKGFVGEISSITKTGGKYPVNVDIREIGFDPEELEFIKE